MTQFSREWAMPNAETFSILPIQLLLRRYIRPGMVVIDPFARNAKFGTVTNDLNPQTTAEHHLDAREFLDLMIDQGLKAEVVIFDPPYSPRQISEVYKMSLRQVDMAATQNGRLYREVKERLVQCLAPDGLAISCGWNTAGFGKSFEMLEILIVSHGGAHNDTLVTVERKLQNGLFDGK